MHVAIVEFKESAENPNVEHPKPREDKGILGSIRDFITPEFARPAESKKSNLLICLTY